MLELKKDIRDRWLAALRSGEYQQTPMRLHKGQGFCCLGVLCDVVKDEMGASWNYDNKDFDAPEFLGSRTSLSQIVLDHVLARAHDTAKLSLLSDLIAMNDKGIPFVEIAKQIEERTIGA